MPAGRVSAGSAWLEAGRPLIIAHRGVPALAPENTLAAFRLAIEQGADGIECDVRRSRDGHLVVIHDASVARVTGQAGEIAAMPLEEIRGLDAGARSGAQFAGERIPSLDEVLQLARGRLLVDIELKVAGIEGQVLDRIRAAGMERTALVTSFLEDAVAAARASGPEVACGLLQQRPEVERARTLGVPVYLPHVGTVSEGLMAECRRLGVKVIPWTIRTAEEAARMVALGVHGLIADDPILARRALAQAG